MNSTGMNDTGMNDSAMSNTGINNKGMNNAGMNNAETTTDRFDDFLRHQLQTDYIDDNGFTAQLMANMPAQKQLNPWLEKLIVTLPVALIAALVLSHFPWRDLVQQAYAWLLLLDAASLSTIALTLFMLMIVAPVTWLLNSN